MIIKGGLWPALKGGFKMSTLKYPELNATAQEIADRTCQEINDKVKDVKSDMPYRSQYVLEEVIKMLESMV